MDIHDKFDRATGNISAYALLWEGKPVGRLVIKFGAAATAYVQIWGAEMVSCRATGYGYDNATAAVMGALARLASVDAPQGNEAPFVALLDGLRAWDGGTSYPNAIEAAGFVLARVI
jgi:hypothetical protein